VWWSKDWEEGVSPVSLWNVHPAPLTRAKFVRCGTFDRPGQTSCCTRSKFRAWCGLGRGLTPSKGAAWTPRPTGQGKINTRQGGRPPAGEDQRPAADDRNESSIHFFWPKPMRRGPTQPGRRRESQPKNRCWCPRPQAIDGVECDFLHLQRAGSRKAAALDFLIGEERRPFNHAECRNSRRDDTSVD